MNLDRVKHGRPLDRTGVGALFRHHAHDDAHIIILHADGTGWHMPPGAPPIRLGERKGTTGSTP